MTGNLLFGVAGQLGAYFGEFLSVGFEVRVIDGLFKVDDSSKQVRCLFEIAGRKSDGSNPAEHGRLARLVPHLAKEWQRLLVVFQAGRLSPKSE